MRGGGGSSCAMDGRWPSTWHARRGTSAVWWWCRSVGATIVAVVAVVVVVVAGAVVGVGLGCYVVVVVVVVVRNL